MPKQRIEGKLKDCKRNSCKHCCCDDGLVEEWIIEFFFFHQKVKDFLLKQGIKIKFLGDRVKFFNCSDGKNCKFLKYSLNNEIDLRPIDCKIYPFIIEWNTVNFDKKIINLYYWGDECPIIKKGIPEDFKKSVESILKRDFAYMFNGAEFKINFTGKKIPIKKNSKWDPNS